MNDHDDGEHACHEFLKSHEGHVSTYFFPFNLSFTCFIFAVELFLASIPLVFQNLICIIVLIPPSGCQIQLQPVMCCIFADNVSKRIVKQITDTKEYQDKYPSHVMTLCSIGQVPFTRFTTFILCMALLFYFLREMLYMTLTFEIYILRICIHYQNGC